MIIFICYLPTKENCAFIRIKHFPRQKIFYLIYEMKVERRPFIKKTTSVPLNIYFPTWSHRAELLLFTVQSSLSGLTLLGFRHLDNQSINQSIAQSLNQSLNHSINQSINMSINQAINESNGLNRSICPSRKQLINLPCNFVYKLMKQTVHNIVE